MKATAREHVRTMGHGQVKPQIVHVSISSGKSWICHCFLSLMGVPTLERGRQAIIWSIFITKLHENEKIWTKMGVRVPRAPHESANRKCLL